MLDFRPDLDPTTPGLLTDMVDMVPTARGYKKTVYCEHHTSHALTLGASESPISSLYATRWLTQPGGIVIAGTNTDLYVYEFTNGFIKVSKAGGYSLAGSTYLYGEDATAAFDQCSFGDILIATHKSVFPQYRSALDRTISTLYANLGTSTAAAPKASVCESAANFLFLGDLAGTWGTGPITASPDMVAWSAQGDHLNFDPGTVLSTQASYAQFTDTPGPITALKRLNDGIVVFKANSMYYGRYVGAGTNSPIWDFVRVSDRIGCIGHRSITDIGGQLVFAGTDDIYLYDGSTPRSITAGIWETEFRNHTNNSGIHPLLIGHDKLNGCVLINRAIAFSGTAVAAQLVWNYVFNKWGVQYDYDSAGNTITLDGQHTYCRANTNTFKVITSIASGSGTASTDHYDLYTMFASKSAAGVSRCFNRFSFSTNYSIVASLTTGAVGNDENVTTFTRVAPKFVAADTAANIRMDYKASLGENWTQALTTTAMNTRYRFDLLGLGNTSVNWARFVLNQTGTGLGELVDIGITPKPSGTK